jgi:hypothetical protein
LFGGGRIVVSPLGSGVCRIGWQTGVGLERGGIGGRFRFS